MIKIAVQSGGIAEHYGVDGAYRLIKETGFDGVDANIDHLCTPPKIRAGELPDHLCGDSIDLELFRPWREAALKYGLDNYQAHAPFPSYMDTDPAYNDRILKMLQNMIRGCDFMDCRNLIVHPFFLAYDKRLDPKTEWELNIERYSALIPVAKEYGVTVCLENMFTNYKGKIYAACCSDFDAACRYVDTLNELAGAKCFGFCLDTGHLLLTSGDIRQTMILLGDRITAFHVHDNNGVNDSHLAPYMGVLDWNGFVEGLAACGFDKTMSFETFNIWNKVDKQLCPSLMRFIAETGRMFATRAEALRG